MVYFGGKVYRKRQKHDFFMRHPGAFHQARFLSKGLYLIKILMMAEIPLENILPLDKRDAVDRIAKFIALFHAKYFLQAFLPTAAPRLDLQYWNDMTEFQNHDSVIATEVTESISRHLWYLTEELAVLALFDEQLQHETRNKIAQNLLTSI